VNETARTSIYLAVAAGLCTLAVQGFSAIAPPEVFEDQGQPFFPEFTELSQATSLEVYDYDPAAGAAVPFKVEYKVVTTSDGERVKRWTIPSRWDHPADDENLLGQVAAAMMNLHRGQLRTARAADHEEYGVVDPRADDTQSEAGRGRRITIRDEAGTALADIIVSKSLDGSSRGTRYVRHPDEDRVYAVDVALDVSTEFSEWIEEDLLQITIARITTITLDRYSIDETKIQSSRSLEDIVVQGERSVVGWVPDRQVWTVEGMTAEEQANEAVIDELARNLRDLRIVDVRDALSANPMALGFWPIGGALYSNEGELHVDLNMGVRCTLRFGEVVASASAGADARPQRYMVISASTRREALSDQRDPEQVAAMRDKVAEYQRRFGRWIYVISSESFNALRPSPESLTEPKVEEDPDDLGGHGDHEGHEGHEGHDDHGVGGDTPDTGRDLFAEDPFEFVEGDPFEGFDEPQGPPTLDEPSALDGVATQAREHLQSMEEALERRDVARARELGQLVRAAVTQLFAEGDDQQVLAGQGLEERLEGLLAVADAMAPLEEPETPEPEAPEPEAPEPEAPEPEAPASEDAIQLEAMTAAAERHLGSMTQALEDGDFVRVRETHALLRGVMDEMFLVDDPACQERAEALQTRAQAILAEVEEQEGQD
jgi:Domain of unknown function (DUF4340)